MKKSERKTENKIENDDQEEGVGNRLYWKFQYRVRGSMTWIFHFGGRFLNDLSIQRYKRKTLYFCFFFKN